MAARAETALLAILSIGLGNALAVFAGTFNKGVSLLATLTAILLQLVCNLANDCGDMARGADYINVVKPPSALQAGLVTLSQVKWAMLLLVTLTSGLGLWLLHQATLPMMSYSFFVFLGMTAITAAVGYTLGDRPYGYEGWGDLAVFAFFGVVGVGGTFYLHTQRLSGLWLLPAVSYGSLAVAVLNLNNIRDHDADMQVGKRTLPVQYGLAWAIRYHRLLLISALVSAVIFTMLHYQSPYQWGFVAAVPLLLQNGYAVGHTKAEQLTPQLERAIKAAVIFAVFLGAGLVAAVQ